MRFILPTSLAVAAGLARSLTTGIGVHVDLAMLEATLAILGPAVLAWTALGTARGRMGDLSWESKELARAVNRTPRGAMARRRSVGWP